MEWLKNKVKGSPIAALLVPTAISGFSFFTNVSTALSDGQINEAELHNLLSAADGFQTLILLVIMYVFRRHGKVDVLGRQEMKEIKKGKNKRKK